ncbi:MAG: PKD domain-containing protein [Deltaproteobacteria bacterium]|nr:PKD domain-containing protein [Deltaproteobacteria bacterium]
MSAADTSSNHDDSGELQIDIGPEYSPTSERHSYLRFDVAGVEGTVARAVLRLWCTNDGSNAQVFTSSSVAWPEDEPTWDAPLPVDGPYAGAHAFPAQDSWSSSDVTGAVTGDGPVTLIFLPTGTDGSDFSSRESVHPPELVVAYTTGATQAPSCSIQVTSLRVEPRERLIFTASAAAASPATITSYAWDFDHDLFSLDVQASGEVVEHAYPEAGTYVAALRVTDSEGREAMSTIRIEVAAPGPEPEDGSRGCGCSLVW